jgi:hypothetical protein
MDLVVFENNKPLLFDEHHHPVGKEQERQMTKAQRDRCRWWTPSWRASAEA